MVRLKSRTVRVIAWLMVVVLVASVVVVVLSPGASAADIPEPTTSGTVLYPTGTWLYADYLAGTGVFDAPGGLSAEEPTESDDDLVQFHGTSGVFVRVGEWYSEPFDEEVTFEGTLEFAWTLSCDTAAADLFMRFYLATGADGRDTDHQYNHDAADMLVAGETVVHTTFEMVDEFTVPAGDTLGFWLYAGAVGDSFDCFLLHNSVENPSYWVFPFGGEPAAEADLEVDVDEVVTTQTGQAAAGSIGVVNNAPANDTVAFGFDELPEGWSASFSDLSGDVVENVTVGPSASATVDFVFDTSGAEPGTYEAVLNVTSLLGFNATYPVQINVEEAPSPTTEPTQSPEPSGNETAGGNGTAFESEGEAIPGPTLVVSLAFLAVVAAWRRRR